MPPPPPTTPPQHVVHMLLQSGMLTDNPAAARLFIVPQFATHETHFCAFNERNAAIGSDIVNCSAHVCKHYLMPIASAVSTSPWFHRHRGSDHVMVFPWDWGYWLFGRPGCTFTSWLEDSQLLVLQYLDMKGGPLENRTVLMPVPQSAPLQSAAVMRNVLMQGQAAGESMPADGSERVSSPANQGCDSAPSRYLATFRGTVWPDRSYSGGIRQDLLALYADSSTAQADEILFVAGHTTPEGYAAEIRDTRFCLCPPGSSSWSQRIYDLVAAGCPLVFFDSALKGPPARALPNVIPWDDFTITIPIGHHMHVAKILKAVPFERICAMRRAVSIAAQYLLWSVAPLNVVTLLMSELLAKSQVNIANLANTTGSGGGVSRGVRPY